MQNLVLWVPPAPVFCPWEVLRKAREGKGLSSAIWIVGGQPDLTRLRDSLQGRIIPECV
jgi:hypothetical protein